MSVVKLGAMISGILELKDSHQVNTILDRTIIIIIAYIVVVFCPLLSRNCHLAQPINDDDVVD